MLLASKQEEHVEEVKEEDPVEEVKEEALAAKSLTAEEVKFQRLPVAAGVVGAEPEEPEELAEEVLGTSLARVLRQLQLEAEETQRQVDAAPIRARIEHLRREEAFVTQLAHDVAAANCTWRDLPGANETQARLHRLRRELKELEQTAHNIVEEVKFQRLPELSASSCPWTTKLEAPDENETVIVDDKEYQLCREDNIVIDPDDMEIMGTWNAEEEKIDFEDEDAAAKHQPHWEKCQE